MSRRKVLVWAAVAAVAAAVLLLRCSGAEDRSLERVRAAGVLRVGYSVEPPYAFLAPGGEVTGQSPETARLVAARLGVGRIEWRLAEFGALLGELREGRVDMVAAGMFITPQRAAQAAFADPLFRVWPGLLVARGNPLRLHSFADALARQDVRVAALTGAVEVQALLEAGLAPARLVLVPDAQTGRLAVETGLADTLALTAPTLKWMAKSQGAASVELAMPFEPPGPEFDSCAGYGAFMFRKEDGALLTAWNREQRELVQSPEYAVLMRDFGFGPENLPGDLTAAEVLGR